MIYDDATFYDGKIMAGIVSVPVAYQQWIGVVPLIDALPELAVDVSHIPIAAKLWNSLTNAPKIPKAQELTTTWMHIQGKLSSVIKYGTQNFSNVESPMILCSERGDTYETTPNNEIMVRRQDGSVLYHLHYPTLMMNPLLLSNSDSDSALFAMWTEECMEGERSFPFWDPNHQENNVLRNVATHSSTKVHSQKVNLLASACQRSSKLRAECGSA